jgi:hypothetical protein
MTKIASFTWFYNNFFEFNVYIGYVGMSHGFIKTIPHGPVIKLKLSRELDLDHRAGIARFY